MRVTAPQDLCHIEAVVPAR